MPLSIKEGSGLRCDLTDIVGGGGQDARGAFSGELPWFEFSFRVGLLLGAGLFLRDALGDPWQKNLFGVAGFLVSALVVATMVFSWRVMGDWRRRTQQVLYVGMVLALAYPVTAALRPELGLSAIPNELERPLGELMAVARRAVPGAGMLMGFLGGLISFFVLVAILLVLVLGGNHGRRGGITVVAFLIAAICLFFYPTAETVAGFLFLAVFLHNQWEVPVMVPDRLRPHLRPVQMEYLRDLVREGALSTGETKVYLENDPVTFHELVDFGLVEFDSISRAVYPGRRLAHDPAAEYLETAVSIARRGVWFVVGITYVLLPDLIPGPIDDAIVLGLCTLSGMNVFGAMRGSRRRVR